MSWALTVKDVKMSRQELENQSLREALKETTQVVKHLQDRVQALEVIGCF